MKPLRLNVASYSCNLRFENKVWKNNFKIVAGLDEVGRGCIAGPLVAAAVVFEKRIFKKWKKIRKDLSLQNIKIDDSKKLTAKQRSKAFKWINSNCLAWGIGTIKVSQIERVGISKATASGFRRAIAGVNQKLITRVDFILIDAFYIPYLRDLPMPIKTRRNGMKGDKEPEIGDKKARQLAIVNGDEKSFSIAAASIIAKVKRDTIMTRLSKSDYYKDYQWDKNKGYATTKHRKQVMIQGLSKYHRKSFCKNITRQVTQ